MATSDELAALLANKLAEMDHMDEDALFSLRWSGGTEPEPLGDAWSMDYLPKGEQLAAVVEQQVRTLRLALAGLIDFWHEHGHHGDLHEAMSHAALALTPLRWDALFLRNPWQRDPAQPCNRFSREQIMGAMIEAEVSDGAFTTMLLKMDELEAQARQTLAGRERPNAKLVRPVAGARRLRTAEADAAKQAMKAGANAGLAKHFQKALEEIAYHDYGQWRPLFDPQAVAIEALKKAGVYEA